MNQTTFLYVCFLLLQLESILSKQNVQEAQSCTTYFNKTQLQGLEPKIQQKICDILLSDQSNVSELSLEQRNFKKPSAYEVWGYGFMMVTFIR